MGALALCAGSLQAANTLYSPGDLVLFFQQQGGLNTVYVNLGQAATLYRGTLPGTVGDQDLTKTNIVNINSSLVSAFGVNWASQGNVYAGLAAARSASTGTGIFDGDQTRTLYVSRGRETAGTIGVANSTGYNLTTSQPYTVAASQIGAMAAPFDNGPDAIQSVITTDVSAIDNYNPFLAPAIQGVAFGSFPGGVQQPGSVGDYGNYAGVGTAEFALDLYRIVPRTEAETVGVEVPGTQHIGSFEGTVVVDGFGNVSFLVPEPSSVTLAGIAGLALALRRRRNA
jgi:hypothetical protein